jgi:hypothetical protein
MTDFTLIGEPTPIPNSAFSLSLRSAASLEVRLLPGPTATATERRVFNIHVPANVSPLDLQAPLEDALGGLQVEIWGKAKAAGGSPIDVSHCISLASDLPAEMEGKLGKSVSLVYIPTETDDLS